MPYYLLIIISYIHFFHIHSCKCIHRHENDHFEPTRFIKRSTLTHRKCANVPYASSQVAAK